MSKLSCIQTIAVYQTTHWGSLMVIDGFVMLTSRDNFLYHEMLTHPALFSHANPKRVLIIGEGDCGTLKEVLAHESVLGMDKNRFNREVRAELTAILIGNQGIDFDRLEMDARAEQPIYRYGCLPKHWGKFTMSKRIPSLYKRGT